MKLHMTLTLHEELA